MFLDLALCIQLVLHNKNLILGLLCARDCTRDFPGIKWRDLINHLRDRDCCCLSQTRCPEAQGSCQNVCLLMKWDP